METFIDIIRNYNELILISIIVLLVILIIIQIVNKVQLSRLSKRYKKLFRNSKTDTLEDMIVDYKNRAEEILNYTRDIHKAYEGIDSRLNGCVQKIGIVRYKAFDDIGSDLSFSIALLDESDTGVVITGIYGRNDSTTFAKQIDNGISKYDISDEEKEAIERAQKHFTSNNKYKKEDIKEVIQTKEYVSSRHSSDEEDFHDSEEEDIYDSEEGMVDESYSEEEYDYDEGYEDDDYENYEEDEYEKK